jgi:3-keto-disaccharide hydrolase
MPSDHRANSRDAADDIPYRRMGLPPVLLAGLCSALCLGGEAFGQKKPPAKAKVKAEDLLSAKAFPKKWKNVSSDKKAVLKATWNLDQKPKIPELSCTGKPPGYVRTIEKFTNFDLTLEWLYPGDMDCNSGILIHCGQDKVWPACIQVQLHRPQAGSIFAMTGATAAAKVTVNKLKLDIGVWHTCRVLSNNGAITVWINRKRVGQVPGCKPSSGYIGLQSEGFPIRFRKLEITRLPGTKKAKPKPLAKKVPPPKVKPKTAFFGGPGRREFAVWQFEPGASHDVFCHAGDAVYEKRRNRETIHQPAGASPRFSRRRPRSEPGASARRRIQQSRHCPAFAVKRLSCCALAAPCRDSSAPADRARP